ncbi:hypothetical protein [Jeotgalibaca ciconiae]|uniref:Type 4a pilus biogenesis protein PilO n=1 Tax=Jeotgalibaca ciconiae TaxID=2496265 RepID=A0A3S9H8H1_9LACT|nr:hypothetical protein [Jeotgalibaca ciconiae]AZP03669.1 hypothetical protein EJN90_02715 [Jeotgalibaca ciconiae]
MRLKWDRLSISLLLIFVIVLLSVFFYGNRYLLSPIKEQADRTTRLVNEQKELMALYPSEEALLEEYQEYYEETWNFLPEGEMVNQEIVALEKLATEEKVALRQVSRVSEPQSIEELDESYMKSGYQVEISSDNSENMQNLIERLMEFERIWNIYSFNFEKNGENGYQGAFIFELFYHIESVPRSKE